VRYQITVVDDERANLESLERILKSDGADVRVFEDPEKALAHLRQESTDVVLTDLRMSRVSGMELLEAIKHCDPSIEVILMTAFGTVSNAVEAMKKGAYDFITKPLQRIQVLKTVHQAIERRKLGSENTALREELKNHRVGSTELIGKSAAMRDVLEVARQAAQSHANVLIDGESGTGKGMIAELIHHLSPRRHGILVKINCAAIPEALLEAELFGHEVGAFTGASRRKKGRVELAHDGTLFLDEIGLAPMGVQAKLLRFIQDGEFERLGGNITHKVDARVICATNVDLKEAIHQARFREDLYYRLNVIQIHLPPLRARVDDIGILSQRFLEDAIRRHGKVEIPILHSETLDCLRAYPWPGNIRELKNIMERMVVLNRGGVLMPKDLPSEFGVVRAPRILSFNLGTSLKQMERKVMEETLKSTRGDKKLAARLLGVHPRTIYRYLETCQSDVTDASVAANMGDDPLNADVI